MKHNRNQPRAPHPTVAAPLRLRGFGAVVAAAVWLGFAAPSFAALGGASASVELDRAHLAARSSAVVNASYTVQIMTLPNGGTVKEYENSGGVVFAVTWRSPSRPDLRQLLGPRFNVLQADVATHRGQRRNLLSDERSDFVLHGAGHSGAFVGSAYLPQAAPSGFSLSALQ